MSGRRPDGSYGPEYGPLPPEHEYASYHHHLPSRGRVPWPTYHGDHYGRPLEQRVRREPFGFSRSPFRLLRFNGGDGGTMINPTPRRENPGLTDDEFRKAMEQLKMQTFNPQKPSAPKSGEGGILHTMSARTEAAPNTEEEKACTICLETLLPGVQVAITPCNHMFHQGCITPWVKGHGNCPVCRFALCETRNTVADSINSDGEDGEVDLDLLAMMRAMEAAFSRVTF